MHSADLPPPEFWFYRVYSELTLSLLHQVNNELTGVAFLSELIRDDVEAGTPPGDKFCDLQSSIEKVIRLTQQTIDAHLPIPLDVGESPNDLGDLLQEGLAMLRLVLPKTIAIRQETPPDCFPQIQITQKEFRLVLAAVGLLLGPRSPRTPGELVVTVETSPAAIVFHPNYPVPGLSADAPGPAGSSPAFLALEHRIARLGGRVELSKNPDKAIPEALRLVLETSNP